MSDLPSLSVLCIGGLDPSGGAGLLADARACAAYGAHTLGVATAIVAQNTQGVSLIDPIAPEVVAAQIEAILADIEPAAVKIGMLPGLAVAEVVAGLLRPLKGKVPFVMDTVFAPSSGPAFLSEAAIDYVAGQLLPLADVVTPNAPEARQLCGVEITDLDSMARAAIGVFERVRAGAVLLKGGHVTDEESELSVDLLFDGEKFLELRARREMDYEVRGTGCLLASALAAQMGDGADLVAAARGAKVWLTQEIRRAQVIGNGRRIAAI